MSTPKRCGNETKQVSTFRQSIINETVDLIKRCFLHVFYLSFVVFVLFKKYFTIFLYFLPNFYLNFLQPFTSFCILLLYNFLSLRLLVKFFKNSCRFHFALLLETRTYSCIHKYEYRYDRYVDIYLRLVRFRLTTNSASPSPDDCN